MNLGNQLVPLFVVFSNRLVHKLVGNRVVAITFQNVRQLVPHIDKVLLCLLRGKQCVGIGIALVNSIEIVRTDDMQVDDGTQVMLLSPIDSVYHQLPSLRQLVALFIPELYLVNRQAYEVEAQRVQTCKVVFLDMLATGLATFFRLRQPVAHVSTTLDAEIVHFVCFFL